MAAILLKRVPRARWILVTGQRINWNRFQTIHLRHGEAVAIGIALDSTYSYLTGLLPYEDWRRILKLFVALGFALYTPELRIISC